MFASHCVRGKEGGRLTVVIYDGGAGDGGVLRVTWLIVDRWRILGDTYTSAMGKGQRREKEKGKRHVRIYEAQRDETGDCARA